MNARSTAMGVYVAAINGYAEKDQGGESGWKKLARRGLRWARGYVQNWTRFYAEKGGMGK